MPEPPKGPELARYVTGFDRLNELISRIQGGQAGSPDEVDQQLQAPSG